MDADGQNGRDFQRISISYACTGREGGFAYKCTHAYSEGGRVQNFDFFAYVIKVWPPVLTGIFAWRRSLHDSLKYSFELART